MQSKKTKQQLKQLVIRLSPLIALAIFIGVWCAASAIIKEEIILPAPKLVLRELWALLGKPGFWQAVGGTLGRSLFSFVISFAVAAILGVLSYVFPWVKRFLSPLVTIARAIPTMSVILLAMIWLTSAYSPLLIGALIVFPIIYASILTSLNEIDADVLSMAKLYKVPTLRAVTGIYVPSVLPSVLSMAKSTISLNVKITIAAEVLAQTQYSMGRDMQVAKSYLNTAELLAWTLAAIALSYALELLVEGVKRLVVRWKKV